MNFNGQDPYDALAAIFLGDGATSPPDALPIRNDRPARQGAFPAVAATTGASGVGLRPPRGAPGMRSSSLSIGDRPRASLLRVTAAVTGHLPVMAGLWATQFADRVGAVDGPTGLIRCECELIHAEILRSGGRHIGLHQGESFEAWLARAARLVRRWIICLPDSGDPADALDPAFAERVLLTSADEAAVAAARRVVAMISDALTERGATASLGVVVVGAPPDRVSWMVDELASAHHGSLDLPLATAIRRMDRVDSSERYGFEVAAPPAPSALLRILELAAESAVDRLGDGVMQESRRPPSMKPRHATAMPDDATASREPSGSLSAALDHEAEIAVPSMTPSAPAIEAERPASVAVPAAPAVALPEAPMPSISAAVAATESTGATTERTIATPSVDLAARLIGLSSLAMRCPVAPGVELACDAGGRLHLVAPLSAAASLRSARAWAVTNEVLLRRAFPAMSAAPSFADQIVERIVTDDAVAVESLHGSGVALDLLIESRLGSSTAFHHVPLNALAQCTAPTPESARRAH